MTSSKSAGCDTWAEQVIAVMTELRDCPALDRLSALASKPPSDAQEVFAALATITKYIDPNGTQPSHGDAAYRMGETAFHSRMGRAAVVFASVYSAVNRQAEQLLDANVNDGQDAWVRLKDFGDGGVSVREMGCAKDAMVGRVDRLPVGHPARAIEPIAGEGLPFIVLGKDSRFTRWRLSTVSTLTAAVRERQRIQREQDAAEEARRKRLQQEAAEQTPEGQRQKIKELEMQVAKLTTAHELGDGG